MSDSGEKNLDLFLLLLTLFTSDLLLPNGIQILHVLHIMKYKATLDSIILCALC